MTPMHNQNDCSLDIPGSAGVGPSTAGFTFWSHFEKAELAEGNVSLLSGVRLKAVLSQCIALYRCFLEMYPLFLCKGEGTVGLALTWSVSTQHLQGGGSFIRTMFCLLEVCSAGLMFFLAQSSRYIPSTQNL